MTPDGPNGNGGSMPAVVHRDARTRRVVAQQTRPPMTVNKTTKNDRTMSTTLTASGTAARGTAPASDDGRVRWTTNPKAAVSAGITKAMVRSDQKRFDVRCEHAAGERATVA